MSLFGAVWREENLDDGLVHLKVGKSRGFTIGIFAESNGYAGCADQGSSKMLSGLFSRVSSLMMKAPQK